MSAAWRCGLAGLGLAALVALAGCASVGKPIPVYDQLYRGETPREGLPFGVVVLAGGADPERVKATCDALFDYHALDDYDALDVADTAIVATYWPDRRTEAPGERRGVFGGRCTRDDIVHYDYARAAIWLSRAEHALDVRLVDRRGPILLMFGSNGQLVTGIDMSELGTRSFGRTLARWKGVIVTEEAKLENTIERPVDWAERIYDFLDSYRLDTLFGTMADEPSEEGAGELVAEQ